MEHLPGGHEPRRLGQQPLSQLRVAGRRPHSPSRPTSSAAAAQERRGGQREARGGRSDRWQPQLYLLEAGACLITYTLTQNPLNVAIFYHVMFVCHLCFCGDPLSSWESEGIGSARHCRTVCVEPKRGEVCPSTCHRTCSALPPYLYSARRPHHQVVA